MRRMIRTGPGVAVIGCLLAGCAAQQPVRDAPAATAAPRRYACYRAQQAIVIDGRLDDAGWGRAVWTAAFVDIRGAAGPPPRYQTRMKLAWDEEYLYVGAWLAEPHVWATLTEHDQIVFHDNDFEVFIDPDGDRRNYYEIEVNPLGTIFDLFLVRTYRDGGPALHGWDLKGMRHAVFVDGTLNDPSDTDRGWSVEFALPFKALAEAAGMTCPPAVGDVWRVNCSRVEWRHRVVGGRYEKIPDTDEDNWVWSPQGVINMHLPQYWGCVEFCE